VGKLVRNWASSRPRKLREESMGIYGTKSWCWEMDRMVPDKNLAIREPSCDNRK